MKKLIYIVLLIFSLVLSGCSKVNSTPVNNPDRASVNMAQKQQPPLMERLLVGRDQDKDGIDDLEDILQGGRAEAKRQPQYVNTYYNGGYPPESEGVCTDVIWRAFNDAGYNLKQLIDQDIKNNTQDYPRVNGRPEPNIDFRRVPNLVSFFKRNATSLTTEIIPKNPEILKQWQGGDIVVFGAPLWHIGIVSDQRRLDGVPLLIHNGGPYAMENDMLLDWPSPLIYHFRFPRTNQ